MSEQSYPLTWPIGWPRTKDWDRKSGPFQMPAGKTRSLLSRELALLGAENVVISSNIMTRRDGLPYARQPQPDDPGVCLYFTLHGKELSMPCDRWATVDANLRAIGMAVQAIRGMDRWGTGQMVDAAFSGFTALPAGEDQPGNPSLPWHEVLQVSPDASSDVIRAAYRSLAMKYHPDQGGDLAKFVELQKAYGEATS